MSRFIAKEKDIERQVLDFLHLNKYFAWKNPTGGYFDANKGVMRRHASRYAIRGTPDIILIIQGKFVGLEVKSKKGLQSEHQKEFESRCRLAGGHYFIIRSVEDLMQALDVVEEEVSGE